MTLTLRSAQKSDLKDLLSLYAQLNPQDPIPAVGDADAMFETILGNPVTTLLLALDSEKVLATCTLVVIPNLTRNLMPYAVIENVVTDEKHRRTGAGKAVMQHAVEEAWKAGCYKVMLMTGKERDGTIAFYESVGFRADRKTGMEIRRPQ